MSKDLLLGIDFGTGGCKIIVLDTSGNVLDCCSGEYPTTHRKTGWSEQNPADWYAVMCRVLHQMQPWKHGKIIGLALDSYTHGAVLLNEKLDVIRPTIVWTDQRSVKECEVLKSEHADLIYQTAKTDAGLKSCAKWRVFRSMRFRPS